MDDWVTAREFWDAVYAANEFDSMLGSICARAKVGLVKTKAVRVVLHTRRGQQTFDDVVLPSGFWWAEGRNPMKLNWASGDFSCSCSEKESRWDSKGISLLVAPSSGVADMLVQAFEVQFDRSGAAKLCASLVPDEEPGGTPLSVADEAMFFAALKCVRPRWTVQAARKALDGLFPGKEMTRVRLREGLKNAGLSQDGPGRPTNAPESGAAK